IIQLLASYSKLKELNISRAYPGHYDILENIDPLIEKQVNRIHMRKEEVYNYLKEGDMGVYDIFDKMYGRNFTGWSMLLGYLDLLEKEGRIQQKLNNSIIEISQI
ncbi:MAG: hypothetical protein AAF696_22955, partial [Bacteroidota bacterium]